MSVEEAGPGRILTDGQAGHRQLSLESEVAADLASSSTVKEKVMKSLSRVN